MDFIRNLKIGTKIYLVSVITVVIFISSLIGVYVDYRHEIYESSELKVAASVETAWAIIDHFSKEVGVRYTEEEAKELAKKTVKDLRYNGDAYFWINDTEPTMIMHPTNPKLDGQNLANIKDPDGVQLFVEMVKVTENPAGGIVHYQWNKPGHEAPQPKISFVKKHPTWNWIIGSGIYVDDLQAIVDKVFYTILAVTLFCLLLITLLVVLLTRSITKPLKATVTVIENMEMGRFNTQLNLNRKDEIGQVAQAMDNLSKNFENVILPMLSQLAQGDITFSPQPKDEFDGPGNALKTVSDNLNDTMTIIQNSARQINSASGQVSDASQSLSQGATQSAASLEEISSSLNQLSGQTRHNAENANQVNVLSTEAKRVAETGNSRMQQMIAAMDEISDASQSINKIIKVIDEIAFQTNLLALNAAVEAARAGQHGKGFAVVAEEVRNLAVRSAKAASETGELIAGSVGKTAHGAEIADQTATALEEILTTVAKVSDLAEEIAAASNEQAEGISQINEGLGQIDQGIQQNTATAEETAATAEELSSQAEDLLHMLSKFVLKGQTGQPSMASYVLDAPKPVRPHTNAPRPQLNNDGWEQMSIAGDKPVIALDDNDFGKY